MTDPYLDALEQLDQMRDRAFKAEAARDRRAFIWMYESGTSTPRPPSSGCGRYPRKTNTVLVGLGLSTD